MCGFIKLFRSLKEWEWYEDHNATRLLIHLLISVNFTDKKWRGQVIKKGSMVLSWSTLANGCGLSIQQCRTAMDKLILSGEVTKDVTNKFQVVSLVKWEKMQIEEVVSTGKVTSNPTDKQQTNNRQVTTTKEREESKIKKIKREGTPSSQEEVYDFFLLKGLQKNLAQRESEKFWNHYEAVGWKVGKNKMQKWKNAAGNWFSRMSEYQKKTSPEEDEKTKFLKDRYAID